MPDVRILKKEPCLFSQRVLVAAIEKGIEFESVLIDTANKPEWFLELSPYGKVPVLQHGDSVVFESSIILEYLDEAFPGVPMMPSAPLARARARFWIDFANSRLHPCFMDLLKAPAASFARAVTAFEDALSGIEAELASSDMPSPYFMGPAFSLVDATFGPAFERFSVLPIHRSYTVPDRFERVLSWMRALEARPSLVRTACTLERHLANTKRYLPEELRAGRVAA
jgi:glutathione S-transferase